MPNLHGNLISRGSLTGRRLAKISKVMFLIFTITFIFGSQTTHSVELTGAEKFDGNPHGYFPAFFSVGNFWTASENVSLISSVSSRVLPACQNADSSNCIESVEYKNSSASKESPWMRASLTEKVLSEDAFPSCLGPYKFDGSDGTPSGGKAPTYIFSNLENWNQSKNFVVSVAELLNRPDFNVSQLKLIVRPINWNTNVSTSDWICDGSRVWTTAVWPEYSTFNENLSLRISLRLGALSEKFMWFSGHVSNAEISRENGLLIISGMSEKRSVVHSDYISCVDPERKNLAILQTFPSCSSYSFMPGFITSSDFQLFQQLRNYMHEYDNSIVFDLYSKIPTPTGTSCASKSVGGMISTDSALFDFGTDASPFFDNSDKSLNFRVANVKENMAGTEHRASFEVILNKDLAKCFWGPSLDEAIVNVNIDGQSVNINPKTSIESNSLMYRIKVSDINNGGTNIKIQATCTEYRIKQNSTVLEINKAIIKYPKYASRFKNLLENTSLALVCPNSVSLNELIGSFKKLSEEADTDLKLSLLENKSSKSVTIICTKGKLVKKVSGVKPKCPSGYKAN